MIPQKTVNILGEEGGVLGAVGHKVECLTEGEVRLQTLHRVLLAGEQQLTRICNTAEWNRPVHKGLGMSK